ncbi:hypothetical protein AB3480_00675 [Rhizobium mongolense]|uniref:hypothetical protein n=1 Tax=Rhizobium mongolense TaxID=57676 RepID=UPI0034A2CC45
MSTYQNFLHARYVAEYLLQRHVIEISNDSLADFFDEQIAEHFAKLAEGLGYTVSPITNVEPEAEASV